MYVGVHQNLGPKISVVQKMKLKKHKLQKTTSSINTIQFKNSRKTRSSHIIHLANVNSTRIYRLWLFFWPKTKNLGLRPNYTKFDVGIFRNFEMKWIKIILFRSVCCLGSMKDTTSFWMVCRNMQIFYWTWSSEEWAPQKQQNSFFVFYMKTL